MQYRKLGRWGLKISCLGMGSYLTIGDRVADDVARELVRTAFDAGVNFFDTADQYNHGRAEEALGDILSAYPRSSFVLATKLFNPMGPGPNDRGLSRKHVIEACHASLRRLKMDYIDIYQCHRPDPDTPIDETAAAMDDLIRQGKVLYWGLSEYSADQIREAVEVCDAMGLDRPVSDQPRYSLVWRPTEREILPTCEAEGLGVVTYSPLGHGVLSGKYAPGAPIPPGTRAASDETNKVMMGRYYNELNLKRVQEMAAIAREIGATPSQLAIAWILSHRAVTSVILGASKIEQLKENLAAEQLTLAPEIIAKLDKLFPIGEE
ncbi:aldo/keto reductase family protein [bacterium]|nr:aldo/keto reductase family protein [bacterium]